MRLATALLLAALCAAPALAQTPGACTLGTAAGTLDVSDVRATPLQHRQPLLLRNGQRRVRRPAGDRHLPHLRCRDLGRRPHRRRPPRRRLALHQLRVLARPAEQRRQPAQPRRLLRLRPDLRRQPRRRRGLRANGHRHARPRRLARRPRRAGARRRRRRGELRPRRRRPAARLREPDGVLGDERRGQHAQRVGHRADRAGGTGDGLLHRRARKRRCTGDVLPLRARQPEQRAVHRRLPRPLHRPRPRRRGRRLHRGGHDAEPRLSSTTEGRRTPSTASCRRPWATTSSPAPPPTPTSSVAGRPAPAIHSTAEEYYNYLRGTWGNGTPITAYGLGYQTPGEVTTWAFPGDPEAEEFWSEVNLDGEGTDNPPVTGGRSSRRRRSRSRPAAATPSTSPSSSPRARTTSTRSQR